LENDFKTGVSLLKQGLPPGNADILDRVSVGIRPFIGFLGEKYLREYISLGGSKIKFVTGRAGSGKTHFLQLLSREAEGAGFKTVGFSAKDVWLHDFKSIYLEIMSRCDLPGCIKKCASQVIMELGYAESDIPSGMSFADYLSSIGELDALTKKEIRNQLQKMFLRNPLMDSNFAAACSLLAGGALGHPALEDQNRELLMLWLSGNKDVPLPEIRRLGLAPTRITKYNARHMLRSLAEVHSLAGCPGMLITIDNVDILAYSSSMDTIRYTKMRRMDAYESIRELIDEIDTLRNIMFVFSFDRKLIDDELAGLKSYYALWARIQNEIVSGKFNQFTDIIDLDALGKLVYTKEAIVEMSARLAAAFGAANIIARGISAEKAEEMISLAQFTGISLPRQVVKEVLSGD